MQRVPEPERLLRHHDGLVEHRRLATVADLGALAVQAEAHICAIRVANWQVTN